MSDEQALLTAINEHPLDDAPRLVYADWLDEQGDARAKRARGSLVLPGQNAARAEFIRVQCEAERLSPGDPKYPALESRAKQLLDEWRKQWLKPFKNFKRSGHEMEFSRGFPVPHLPRSSVKDLHRLVPDDLRAAPLWRHNHGASSSTLNELLDWPQLHRLANLWLFSSAPDGWVERIADCPGLRNVTELALVDLNLTPADLKRVLDAWTGRRLNSFWVNECTVGNAGARVIANHPALAELRLLRAHSAGITSRGIKAIVDSPYLNDLTLATFAHNTISDTGGKHLLQWRALPHIKDLYLMNMGLTPGVEKQLHKQLGKRGHF